MKQQGYTYINNDNTYHHEQQQQQPPSPPPRRRAQPRRDSGVPAAGMNTRAICLDRFGVPPSGPERGAFRRRSSCIPLRLCPPPKWPQQRQGVRNTLLVGQLPKKASRAGTDGDSLSRVVYYFLRNTGQSPVSATDLCTKNFSFSYVRDEENSKGGSESVRKLLPGKIGKKDGKSGVPLSNNKEPNWQRARVREEMEEDLRKPPPKDRDRVRGGGAEKFTEDGREREQCEPCEGSLPIAPEREEAQRT